MNNSAFMFLMREFLGRVVRSLADGVSDVLQMANPAQQLLPFPTGSSDERKTIPFASQQPSNQLPGK